LDTTVQTSFHAIGLSEPLLRDLAAAGFLVPTPIQAQAIPPALAGRDVIGCAQTGTGKTAAFVIPMIERLALLPKGQPQALVLSPTRELALQIFGTIEKLGRSHGISATVIVGGSDMQAQIRGLRQRPDILVATPGRLLDHMWNGTVNLAPMKFLVLDEADRMLDLGFAPQINQILDALPLERQTLLFSATIPEDVTRLVQASLHGAVHVMIASPSTTAEGVTQVVRYATSHEKEKLLGSLLMAERGTVLVFARTKSRVDRLGQALEQAGHSVAVIHGDLSLPQRLRALNGFKRGLVRILIATDIAARGIDVASIGHVVNYDLPNCPEDYIHRVGRTARMKMTGRATSFVTPEERDQLRAIETLLGYPVPLAEGSPHPSDRWHPKERVQLPSRDRHRWGRPGEDRRQHQPNPIGPERI